MTESGSALHADERDTHTSTCQAKSCKSASSSPALSSISENEGWSKHPTVSTNNDNTLKTASSIASLKGAIGTYRHGRIQWRLKDKHGLSAVKSLKPKIHVVIPSGAQDRAQPTAPGSGHPSNAQVRSASAELEEAYDISPPTGTSLVMMRDSIVSPLSRPPPLGQLQVPTPTTPTNSKNSQHRKINSTSTTSSVGSRESDAFSLHSNQSSETSVEEDDLRMLPKTTGDCPAFGIDFGPPPAIPPRRYAPCSAKDAEFKPTCTIKSARDATNGIVRRPTVHRKTSNSSSHRRSLDSNPGIGAINQAINRTESKKSKNERSASPTLSEAETELQRSLTTLSEDTFLGRIADNDRRPLTPRPQEERNQHPWRKHMTRPSAEPAPLLPRKSSKRQSVINTELFRLSRVPKDHIASQITRGRSLRREQRLSVEIPSLSQISHESMLSPVEILATPEPRVISPGDAEKVLHQILQSVDNFEDLFALGSVNVGFYKVFKRHELELVKSVVQRTSPAAWEFREYAFPGHDILHDDDLEMTRPFEEYTPASYLHLQQRDTNILHEIKLLIHEKCQSFVRAEISAALVDEKSPNAARVDDALWRIWTFCKIFGSGKGREDDVVAQQDWLQGGVQAHQPACTFSVMSTDFMNDTLIGAPDCFAQGNEGGLSAEQLFDMMELWNCLGVLLQGFQTRTAEARKYGIYDDTEIRGGDIDGEEMMLDEWIHHVLSFGLATVLFLARPCYENNGTAFTLADAQGLTKWKSPVHGSTNRSFLKEAASRVYEDKLAHVYAESSTRELQRQMSKQRIQKHIQDLKHYRSNGQPIRMIRQSQDRPMSEWEKVMSSLTRVHPPLPDNNLTSHIPSFRPTSAIAQEISTHIFELPAPTSTARALLPPLVTHSTPQRTIAQPLLPTPSSSTVSGPRSSPRRVVAQPLLPTPSASITSAARDRTSTATSAMPSIIEHPIFLTQSPQQIRFPDTPPCYVQRPHVPSKESDISLSSRSSSNSERSRAAPVTQHPVYYQHPAQADIFDSPAYENTAEKAIYRIVEMGFTAEQARDALRVTDAGDGLRVDRAVELLLSRQM
ncbi:hypothetical protein C7974DRAFT_317648 [Boeremia exigua]|uniref:uncharacterized protein n=1 Tax=Boeremia exigua TaxID=749465 RepID=UPI001E8D2764|nr:uncharacterized protein C7974DRAFT_317648 [Boeremia exigua]KAH6618652.1 hypothetical protein C7974DRAFT_317648 [Boeremia exigua]